MDLKTVSVIVVNFNARATIVDCVASVIDDAFEVLIVDNASTDDSLDLLREVFGANPKLVLLENEVNAGFAVASNRGVRAASGAAFLFLNPDCVFAPGTLHRLVGALEARPSAAMAGGLLLNEDGTEQGGGRRAVPTPWRSTVRALGLSPLARRWPRLFQDFYLHREPLPAHPIEVEAISGACMLVSRAAVEDVGLLDEGYFLHCEDLDWCFRFRKRQWSILFVPDAPMVHYRGTSSRNRFVFVEWHKHRGMIRFYRTHLRHQYPFGLMAVVTAGVWIRFTALVIRHALATLVRR